MGSHSGFVGDDEVRVPIVGALSGLARYSLEPGETAIDALILIKTIEPDGETSWVSERPIALIERNSVELSSFKWRCSRGSYVTSGTTTKPQRPDAVNRDPRSFPKRRRHESRDGSPLHARHREATERWRNGHEDQQAQLGSFLKHRARTVRTDHRRNIKEVLTQNRQG